MEVTSGSREPMGSSNWTLAGRLSSRRRALSGRGDLSEYVAGRDESYIYFLMGTPRYSLGRGSEVGDAAG